MLAGSEFVNLYITNTSMVIVETTLEAFERDVVRQSRQRPMLVDFWADWCAPCLVIAPVLERVLEELGGAVGLAKLEVDEGENMKLAGHYRVRGFPTVILFDDGAEVARFSGARSRPQILEFIRSHIHLPDPV
jgi:putative thioredoxin